MAPWPLCPSWVFCISATHFPLHTVRHLFHSSDRGSGRGDGIWPLSLFVWLYLPHSFRLHVSGQRALEDSCFHVEPSLSSLILLSSYVFSLWHQCHRLFVYTPPLPWAATDKNEIGTTELLQVDSRFCRPRSLNQFDFYADFSNHLKWWPFLQMNK